MAYVTGYKRPRQDESDLAAYAEYGQYGHPSDLAQLALPGSLLPPLQQQPLQPQAQPLAPDSIRLGSAPDGSMPVVKLRGLPFSCDIDSINMFLEVETVDVVLVRRQGRFSGEAFVVLPGMMQVEFALNKHKAYMGKRYVEVQQSSREDYYKAVAAFVEDWSTGLVPPPSHSGYDIRGAAEPPGFRQSYGQFGGGPPSGRGFDRGQGNFRAPPRERRFENDKDRAGPGPPPATGVLRLRGLPFGVSAGEVAAWFNDAGVLQQPIATEDVHSVLAYDGRPTGSAFVQFSGPADAENAMAKDKAMMGTRYVELFHSCNEEMLMATQGR